MAEEILATRAESAKLITHKLWPCATPSYHKHTQLSLHTEKFQLQANLNDCYPAWDVNCPLS